ncbi:MAG: thermostable hemolysin [Gammaproteobacteria bacterium]
MHATLTDKPFHSVSVNPEDSAVCQSVKGFIASVFAKAYGAHVTEFMPTLLTIRGEDAQPQAALGIRPADDSRLFLEHYLDERLESAMGRVLARPIDRASIVEVGNLAAVSAGGARFLITALTAYLKAQGYQWAAFTATPLLQRSFKRLGIDLVHISDADPMRLDDQTRESWGSYYKQPPSVMVASVEQSADALRKLMALESSIPMLSGIWRQASHIKDAHIPAHAA